MATIKTKFAVGLFVIIGFAVIIVAVIWLGMSSYFETGRYYAAYFDESVQGLDKDSPVKYRGVSIGRVDSIGVAPDATLIQVVLKIESGLEPGADMVAQLKSVGITGIMFVELDRKTENEPDLSPLLTFPSKYPVIATKPSDIKKLIASVNEVLDHIKLLDLEGISSKIKATLDHVNRTVEDAQIKNISSDIRSVIGKMERIVDPEKWDRIMASVNALIADSSQTVANVNETVSRVDRLVENNQEKISQGISLANTAMEKVDRLIGTANEVKDIADTVAKIHDAVAKADELLGRGTTLVKETESGFTRLQQSLLISLRNLEQATRSLNRSIEIIADQPSQLIFGQPPPARQVEAGNPSD